MNQRKLSKLWSSLFAVMMLLVGVSTSFAQVNAYDQNGTLIQSFLSCDASLQDAINATPLNGEVRILAATCNPAGVAGSGVINISNNLKLTSGVGGSTLVLSFNDILNINSGTVTLGTGINNIDINIGSTVGAAQLNIAAGATLVLNGAGNTVGVTNDATVTNNGAIVTALSPRTVGAANILGTNLFNTNNAPAGVYYQDAGGVLAGTGTWGNIFVADNTNWTPGVNFAIADNAEVVVANGSTLTITAARSFTNIAKGTFDFQFQDGSTFADAGNALTINGNLYTEANSAGTGNLTVQGETIFGAGANYTGFPATSTFHGNLTVIAGAVTTLAPSTVNAWADVTVGNGAFAANLVFPNQAPNTQALSSTAQLTSVSVNASQTVNFTSDIDVLGGLTTSATGSVIVDPTFDLTVGGAVSNSGSITKNGTGDVEFNGTVTNNVGATITHAGSDDMDLGTGAGDVTSNSGNILLTSSGTMNIWQLTNNAINGVVNNSSASGASLVDIRDLTNPNNGLITNSGAGSVVIDDVTVGGTANAGTISNTGAGSLTIEVDVLNTGTLTRTNGSFTIEGSLTNQGASAQITNNSSTFDLPAPGVGVSVQTQRQANAQSDGIIVNGNFVNSSTNVYSGNVIMSPTGGAATVSSSTALGSLTIRSNATTVAATSALTIARSLHLGTGTFNLAANNITMTAGGNFGTDNIPNYGIYMGPNTQWVNGQVIVQTSANVVVPDIQPSAGFGFFQASAGVPAGSLRIQTGMVQLLSNVNVSNITIDAGSTLRKPFGTFCYELVVAGTSTINGAVIECGVFVITNAGAGSIRAQLIANGFDPDNMNQSIQIAIGAGATINLTDAVAENGAAQADWLGVTIVNTQSRFIMSSGRVNLNYADLTLRGAFVYAGDWTNATPGNRTLLTAQVNDATDGGWLVFTGLNVQNADFVFVEDGVNSTEDSFTIRRLRFNRTGSSLIRIVDNNNVNAGNVPSSVIVTEKLEVIGSLQVGDNNIKYIGGNPAPLAVSSTTTDYRSIAINTNDLVGSGFFWLANNDQGADDNTIDVTGGVTGGIDLQMQFLKSGDAGQRNLATTNRDRLVNVATIGNGGMNYVRAGWLQTGILSNIDGDFTLGADQATLPGGMSQADLEVQNSLMFPGNLFIMDNNSGVMGNPRLNTEARLFLSGSGTSAATRTTTVKGIFQTASVYTDTDLAGVQTSGSGTAVHNLRLEGRVIFGANNDAGTSPTFYIPRPSRVIFASATNKTFENVGTPNKVSNVRIHRVEFNAGSTTTTYLLPTDLGMQVNDLLLTNGLFNTNGRLAMVDLSGAANDPNSTLTATELLSIVTRARTGTTHGQITRGTGSFGAYTSFTYSATGGAPFTVQHIGSASRFSGDEVPGLVVVNTKTAPANLNNSVVQRLVIDLASETVEFELAKDLIINQRIEVLTGSMDIAQSAFLDIAPNAQWVHGHAKLTDVAATGVIRFPNMSGNTVAAATGTSTYDLLYVSKQNHTTGYEYQTGNGVRHLTIYSQGTKASPITVTLNENKTASGTVRVVDGNLNLGTFTLSIAGNLVVDGAYNGDNLAVNVNNNNNAMVSPWFPSRVGVETPSMFPYLYSMSATAYDDGHGKIVDTNGTLEFIGTSAGSTYILGYVRTGEETVSLPNVVVNKTGSVIFDIDQAFIQSPDDQTNTFSVLSFLQKKGTTHLRPGAINVPQANIGDLNQSDAPLSGVNGAERVNKQTADGLSGVFGTGFTPDRMQNWEVRQNMTVETGDFFAWGAEMNVLGNYLQGDGVNTTAAVFWGGQNNGAGFPGMGQTSLHMHVLGNFTVLTDGKTTPNNTTDNAAVHRFYLSNGWVSVGGNYSFFGHFDVTSGVGIPDSRRGARGTFEFNGDAEQTVWHLQAPRAQFQHVVVNGAGIALSGSATDHMWLNDIGVFTFQHGNVVTGPRELRLQNTTLDEWNVNFVQDGAIRLSGSNSYVDGNLRRWVSQGGTSGGGYIEVGYIFPLGNGTSQFSQGDRFYRPLTIQFPQNLGSTRQVVASSSFGAAATNPALVVNGLDGNINLNSVSPIHWTVSFDQAPALEPNIRLGVQGLLQHNSANIDDMRIVTSENGTPWRMAGVYDLTAGTNPDDTFNPNDYLDGIPTFFQEGLDFIAQTGQPTTLELRIATDEISNPFDGNGAFAYLQIIHNSPAGAVDVLVDGVTLLNDFAYQNATGFGRVKANTSMDITITTANGATTLLAINGAVLEADKNYILIAQGGNNGKAFEVKVVDNARRSSTVANGMQFFFSHGVTNGPTVNVERVTTSTPRTLEQLIAVNAAYGSTTSYMTQLNPSISTLQLKAGGAVVGQYLFDFGNYAGETMTLLATGAVGGTGANALTIIGVDAAGNVLRPAVTTSDEGDVATELPAEFTLNGNFPNPFNPTTNISFDLPEQANVRVEIVDLLGRQVMTVAPQSMSAGANKVITVDAARLSSGVYFYRVIAEGATKTFVQGSKFTLVK